MDYDKIGKFIQEKRKEKDLTQKELAKKIYLTDKAISKWERGLGCPDVSVLEDLSNVLEVSILSILTGEEHEEEEVNSAILKTINYSKNQEKSNFKRNATNFFLIIIFSVIGFLLHANIAHMLYLEKINKVGISYETLSESILFMENIEENINTIKNSNLKYSEDDMKVINEFLEKKYNYLINHDFYGTKESKIYTLKEVYNILNNSEYLNSIQIMRIIAEYAEYDTINIKSYIDFTLLRMFNKQNIFLKINSIDSYQTPFDFKSLNYEHLDSLALTLDFRIEVYNLYDITNYILKVGEVNE
jgi:transcriptional regulator with XRE-family HTH domain